MTEASLSGDGSEAGALSAVSRGDVASALEQALTPELAARIEIGGRLWDELERQDFVGAALTAVSDDAMLPRFARVPEPRRAVAAEELGDALSSMDPASVTHDVLSPDALANLHRWVCLHVLRGEEGVPASLFAAAALSGRHDVAAGDSPFLAAAAPLGGDALAMVAFASQPGVVGRVSVTELAARTLLPTGRYVDALHELCLAGIVEPPSSSIDWAGELRRTELKPILRAFALPDDGPQHALKARAREISPAMIAAWLVNNRHSGLPSHGTWRIGLRDDSEEVLSLRAWAKHAAQAFARTAQYLRVRARVESPSLAASVSARDRQRARLSLVAQWWDTAKGAAPSLGDLVSLDPSDPNLPRDVAAQLTALFVTDLGTESNTPSPGSDDFSDVLLALTALTIDSTDSASAWGEAHRARLQQWLDYREWEAFLGRSGLGQSRIVPYREIGDSLAVSTERARQLAKQAVRAVDSEVTSPEFAPLRWRAHELSTRLGVGAPLASDAASAAFGNEQGDDELALWLAGPYSIKNGWLVKAGEDPAGDLTRAVLDEPTPLLEPERARDLLSAAGVPVDSVEDALATTGVLRPLADGWVRWHGSIADKAEAVLSLLARPATVDEIRSHFFEDRAVTSIRNAIAADDRFVRAGKTTWALALWDVEEYSGISQEIFERIDRDGGETDLTALVEELVSLFGVSEVSVRTYASTPAFVVEQGKVRRRLPGEAVHRSADLDRASRVYRPDTGRVVARFEVTAELLRGSGLSVGVGLARQLGVEPGEQAAFRGEQQVVSVSWRATSAAGPQIGSLRTAALALGAIETDQLVVEFDLDRQRSTIRVVGRRYIGRQRVRALTGIGGAEPLEEALAAAIAAPLSGVLGVLRRRGELDLVELLTGAPTDGGTGAHVEALASFLDGL